MTVNTIGARLNWQTTAQGSKTVPLLLISGMNAVFVPEGLAVTGCALSATVDSLWPFGATTTFDAGVVKPWLSLPAGIRWAEHLIATDPQALDVGALEVRLSDVDLAATILFASRDTIYGTEITQEVSATDATIHVVSTTGFAAAPAAAYIGREAFTYTGLTGTTFTGCTRGMYGSVPCRHPYAGAAGGVGIEVPEVTTAPYDVVNRPASVWMATIEAGIITAIELSFFGHVGVDATLAEDGGAWVLRIDHAVQKLSQPPRSVQVTIAGYSHVGNRQCRTGTGSPRPITNAAVGRAAPCPLWVNVVNPATGAFVHSLVLSDESADPDNGGWHPTREVFLQAFQRGADAATAGSGNSVALSLTSEGTLRIDMTAPALQIGYMAPWASPDANAYTGGYVFQLPGMPAAWVPIRTNSRIYLSPTDYALVPTLPTNPVVGVSTYTEIYYVLAVGDSNPSYARITDRVSSGGVQYLVATAVELADLPIPSSPGAPWGRERGGAAFVVTEPTPARLLVEVRSDNWVDALEAFLVSLDTDAGDQLAQAIDFGAMRAVVARFTPSIPVHRDYFYDVKQTPLQWLINESALAGFSLVVLYGRISITRIAEFAVTESTAGTLETARLQRKAALPGYSRGAEGIINRMTFKWAAREQTLNVIDRTSVDKYGASRTALTATIPYGIGNPTDPGDALFTALFALGMTAIGPYRQPVERVEVNVTTYDLGLQTGDLVLLTMWAVPNDAGGRGLTSVIGQVVGREPEVYGEQNAGVVKYTLRLSPSRLAGWSPSIFVAAGGISGAVVTADTTTFGANGCAPRGQNPTLGFDVGAKVRMMELNSLSPTAATQHTVTGASGSTLTLSPAPNATFVALAAAAVKVGVFFDDYDTAGLTAAQAKYAWLAPRATLMLGTGVRAQRYAA